MNMKEAVTASILFNHAMSAMARARIAKSLGKAERVAELVGEAKRWHRQMMQRLASFKGA